MIVSVPLLLLYFLFVLFLSPFLVFLSFSTFFYVMFCGGSFLLLLHFCIFWYGGGRWEWNADWILSLLFFSTYIYTWYIFGFGTPSLDYSAGFLLSWCCWSGLLLYPWPPDTYLCLWCIYLRLCLLTRILVSHYPFTSSPHSPNRYMLARIDANALRSSMKFRGSVEWLVDVWDDVSIWLDSTRTFWPRRSSIVKTTTFGNWNNLIEITTTLNVNRITLIAVLVPGSVCGVNAFYFTTHYTPIRMHTN